MLSLPAAAPLGACDDPTPHGRWLSNGRYGVLATGTGTGASTWDGHALTRFRADRVEDGDGLFVWLGDVEGGALFSLGRQPTPGDAVHRGADGVAQVVADRHPQLHPALAGGLHLDAEVLPEAVRASALADAGQQVLSHGGAPW